MKVYEESGCFDPNSMTMTDCPGLMEGLPVGSSTNSHNSLEDSLNILSSNYNHHASAAAMEMEIQQHYVQEVEAPNNVDINCPTTAAQLNIQTQVLTQPELSYDQSNWDGDHHSSSFNMLPISSSSPDTATAYPPTPDLLNLFHLPRCSNFLPNNSSISFDNPPASSFVYDPLFHLNLPPQPPVFRDLLLQSLPHGYTLPADHDRDAPASAGALLYQDGDNGILEFSRENISMAAHGKGRDHTAGKTTKHFATERERRVHLNDKYKALRNMVPNPTKNDRASIVGDAIGYIKELLRTVDELKLLVEKKRCGQDRSKRRKTEDAASAADAGDLDQCYNTSLRSSWLQRKSKDTEVDVRIIDDEVTIKLVQRKKINCLLFVSRLLDELQLDLHHVAGGNIGDYYSFLFNTKIYEGSSVYASAIANKLIEVVDRQYAAAPPTSSTCQ